MMLNKIFCLQKWFYFCIVFGLSHFVCAQNISLMNPQAQSIPHELKFVEAVKDDQTQARAILIPEAHEVTVANRLILVSAQALTLDRFSTQVRALMQTMELLVNYQGRYVYLVQSASIKQMLELKALLTDSPLLLYLQPDLLPLRKPVQRPPLWNAPQEFNEHTFRLADYLPLQPLWQKTRGKGIRIAVIDSGINPNHPALQKMPIKFNWNVDENLPETAPEQSDLHGTWVAGIIWARPELVTPIPALTPGVAWGIAPEAELIALKLRRPWTSNLLRVFALAEQQQADVINISWLLPWVAAPVRDYLQYLTRDANHHKGIVVVAAADPQYQPNLGLAAMDELLVVSSTDHRGLLANSSWDAGVDIAAATYILSVSFRPPVLYERFAKTSATAPLVTGLMALFRAARPDLTASQLQLLLVNSTATAEARLPDGQLIHYKKLDANKAYKQLLVERLRQ